MGLRNINFTFIHKDNKKSDIMPVFGGAIGIGYDTEPHRPRKAAFGIAIQDAEVADAIAADFKQIAKILRKQEKEKCKTGVKGFAATLKKKAKSPSGSKKVKKSTTTRSAATKSRASKASKSAPKRGK